jgi:hypothetical protein
MIPPRVLCSGPGSGGGPRGSRRTPGYAEKEARKVIAERGEIIGFHELPDRKHVRKSA